MRWANGNNYSVLCAQSLSYSLSLLSRSLRRGLGYIRFRSCQFQEDLFQTQTHAMQLIELPSGLDHGPRELGTDMAVFLTFDGKARPAVARIFRDHAAHARHLLQLLVN